MRLQTPYPCYRVRLFVIVSLSKPRSCPWIAAACICHWCALVVATLPLVDCILVWLIIQLLDVLMHSVVFRIAELIISCYAGCCIPQTGTIRAIKSPKRGIFSVYFFCWVSSCSTRVQNVDRATFLLSSFSCKKEVCKAWDWAEFPWIWTEEGKKLMIGTSRA